MTTEPAEALARALLDHARAHPGVPITDDGPVLVDHDVLADEAIDLLAEVATTDPVLARRFGETVLGFAGRLDPDTGGFLRGATHHVLARLAAEQDDWSAALDHAAAVGPADPGLGPLAEAFAERVRAVVAYRAGEHLAALEHCTQAVALCADQDAEDEVAEAAVQAAGVAEELADADAAVDWWRRAARALSGIGEYEEAGRCAVSGARAARTGMHALGDARSDRALELAEQGLALAEAYHLAPLAGELAGAVGTFGADVGRPWTVCAEAFERGRHWFADQPEESLRIRELQVAWVDFSEGNAAILLARPADAEPPLRRALDVFTRYDDHERVTYCLRLLRGTVGFTSSSASLAEAITTPEPAQAPEDPEHEALVLLARFFALSTAERDRAAATTLPRVRELAVRAGSPIKAALADLVEALYLLRAGDASAARRRLAYVDRNDAHLTGPTAFRHFLDVMRESLRGQLAEHDGDREGFVAALEAVEHRSLARGSGMLAAFTAASRAEVLRQAGRPREALDLVLPAVLALDAHRFTLDDADRRRRWTASTTAAMATAFRAAAACGAVTELAELIEVARGNGAPTPRTENDRVDTLDRILDEAGRSLLGEEPGPYSSRLTPMNGALAVAADARRTVLGVPPRITTPWGTVALAAPLARAEEYHSPMRSERHCQWRIRELGPLA